jgi:predicted DNA-binding protein
MGKSYSSSLKIKVPPNEQQQLDDYISKHFGDDSKQFSKEVIAHINQKVEDEYWHPFSTKEGIESIFDNYMHFYVELDDIKLLDQLAPLFGVRRTTLYYGGALSYMAESGAPITRRRVQR